MLAYVRVCYCAVHMTYYVINKILACLLGQDARGLTASAAAPRPGTKRRRRAPLGKRTGAASQALPSAATVNLRTARGLASGLDAQGARCAIVLALPAAVPEATR